MLADVDSKAVRTVAQADYRAGLGLLLHLHDNPWSGDGRFLRFTAGAAHGVCD
jgi:hypothetical protein